MPTLDSSIFDLAPIPMWLEDYSGIKIQFDEWRDQGIQDLRTFLREDLERVRQCAHKIKLIRVNQKTLQLLKQHRLSSFATIWRLFFSKTCSIHI